MNLGIPTFLDRIQGRSREDIDAERLLLVAKHGRIKIKSPRLKNPKAPKKATGLGMSLQELKKIALKGA